ncbi:MAG: SDR family NAD(P)-dependent oxidoreductase [Streptosporangiaceae bacterium]
MPTAVITGASQGLGRVTARALAGRGWSLVVDARHAGQLAEAVDGLTTVTAIPGDVTDPAHRAAIAAAITPLGRLDLLMNNASHLGPSPQPALRSYPLAEFGQVYQTNVLAPLALIQLLAGPLTAAGGAVVNVSSDAATDAYPGWGGYGSAKAALDQLTAVLAAEEPGLRCYAFDPGDMRTAMHQRAFPGEDISGRPEPEVAAAALLRLLGQQPPSGRYRASDYPPAGLRTASPGPADPGADPAVPGPAGQQNATAAR